MKNKGGLVFAAIISITLTLFIGLMLYNNSQMVKLEVNEEVSEIEFTDKPNLYLFWGEGCAHCTDLKAFMDTLSNEYKEIFTYNMFEVLNDLDNAEFMMTLAEELGDDVSGVPYMIIGDKSFSGYNASDNEAIREAIKELEETEYDVYKNLENGEITSQKITFDEYDSVNKNGILIDVREEAEYAAGHVSGSINIPVSDITEDIKNYDKDAQIFVYCQSGGRSSDVAMTLVELGYTNVYDLGGLNDAPDLELVKN